MEKRYERYKLKKIDIFLIVVCIFTVSFLMFMFWSDNNKRSKELVKEKIPGIVCWGDSLTQGIGTDVTNYPVELEKSIKKNIYDIPVINMGVGGEKTTTIIGRAGSVPFLLNSFTIPANTTPIEISLYSANGFEVAPLRMGDAGVNPVSINGIKGTLSIEQESSKSKDYKYYFQRTESGEQIEIQKGTNLITSATNDFSNYIPIVFMGQNLGYSDEHDLIKQINSIINMEKYSDKYLVLGLTSGTAESRADLEQIMKSEYGNRYINLRQYIVENGLVEAKIEPTDEDKKAISEGSIPPSLLSDPVHFNAKGYTIIGKLVYERMNELGYFDEVKNIIKEYSK